MSGAGLSGRGGGTAETRFTIPAKAKAVKMARCCFMAGSVFFLSSHPEYSTDVEIEVVRRLILPGGHPGRRHEGIARDNAGLHARTARWHAGGNDRPAGLRLGRSGILRRNIRTAGRWGRRLVGWHHRLLTGRRRLGRLCGLSWRWCDRRNRLRFHRRRLRVGHAEPSGQEKGNKALFHAAKGAFPQDRDPAALWMHDAALRGLRASASPVSL